MIKNNSTIEGIPVASLTPKSNKKIIRICDFCKKEEEISYCDYTNSKTRKQKAGKDSTIDNCKACMFKVFDVVNKGTSQSKERKLRISQTLKKRYAEQRGEVVLDLEKTSEYIWTGASGYLYKYDQGKKIPIHRDIYEKQTGEDLNGLDLYHIDGNKQNNDVENLIPVTKSEHLSIHRQLQSVALELYREGKIKFNRDKKKYYVDRNPQL